MYIYTNIYTYIYMYIHIYIWFQRWSALEKGMRDWFHVCETRTIKCVLCRPGGIGKSTLVSIFHSHLWSCSLDLFELIFETCSDNHMFLDNPPIQHLGP